MLTQIGPEGPQAGMTSFPGSEITENADISEVSPVAVGIEAEQEGPLEGDEAPDAGEVVAGWVFETCRRGTNDNLRDLPKAPPAAKTRTPPPLPTLHLYSLWALNHCY